MNFIIKYFLITMLTVLVLPAAAQSATKITGTVTAKQAGTVKVEFKPHKTAGPRVDDLVDFKTTMQGLEVNAGQGKVTKASANYAWVKVVKGRPNLKMEAVIHATGQPGPQEYCFRTKGYRQADDHHGWPAADIKLELQPGLVFENEANLGVRFVSRFPIGKDGQAFGKIVVGQSNMGQFLMEMESETLPMNHKRVELIRFAEGGSLSRKVKFIWSNRTLSGIAAKCISSCADVNITISGNKSYYREFFATCSAGTPLGNSHGLEPLFTLELVISYPDGKILNENHWEKIFLHAMESLSIKFKE
jgi:hypothetical protein